MLVSSFPQGLQPREAEVYACIEGETGSPVSSQSPPSKVCPGGPGGVESVEPTAFPLLPDPSLIYGM